MKATITNKKRDSGIDILRKKTSFLIWQISNFWKKQVRKKLGEINLTYVQVILLDGLNEMQLTNQTVTQIQLAQYVNCNTMVTSNVLRHLKQKGYVSITEHIKDTRAKVLKITAKGKKMLEEAVPMINELNSDFFSCESEKSFRTRLQLLWERIKGKEF